MNRVSIHTLYGMDDLRFTVERDGDNLQVIVHRSDGLSDSEIRQVLSREPAAEFNIWTCERTDK